MRIGLALIAAELAFGACGRSAARSPVARLLHAFGPEQTALYGATLLERGLTGEPSRARGQQVTGEIVRARRDGWPAASPRAPAEAP